MSPNRLSIDSMKGMILAGSKHSRGFSSMGNAIPKSVKVLTVLCIVAFLVAAGRFVPAIGLSVDVFDFAAGLGVGLGIALIVAWALDRAAR